MKNLTWQNPEQLFVAQELINKVKSKCCGIKDYLLHSNCFALLSIYSIREEVAAGKLKIIDIDELNINRMFYIIHRQGEPDPYAKQFIEFSLRQKF